MTALANADRYSGRRGDERGDEGFYPDLVEQGGLDSALQAAFERAGSAMRVVGFGLGDGPRLHVAGRFGNRSSQVSIAAKERLFLFDCWARGVLFATGAAPDLDRAATVVDRWVGSTCATAEMAAAFDFVRVKEDAWAYEQGVEVEARWRDYLKTVPEELPDLAAVVREASTRPELRRLFLFTRLNSMCFSRCTGYPFTKDVPVIWPKRSGGYQVFEHPSGLTVSSCGVTGDGF